MKDGAFVEIDYLAKVKDGRYFDVTDEARAKEYDLYQDDRSYGPVKIVVGAGQVLPGLDEALLDMSVGEVKDLVIPAEKGFGKRNPKLVTTVPMREFAKQGIAPRPGMSLEIGDQVAHVKSVSSGRVIVDFNHALAGRSLEYNLTVVSEITDPAEKIRALFELHLGIFDELKHKISVEDNVATIILEGVKPGVEEVVQQLLRKDIEKYVPEIEKVSFGDEPEEEPEPSEDAESDNESESTE